MGTIADQLLAAGLTTPERVNAALAKRPARTSWKPPRKNGQHGRSQRLNALGWEHENLGSVEVATNWELGPVYQDGPNSWAWLERPTKADPSFVRFTLTGGLANDVRLLHISGPGDLTDMGTQEVFPEFKVPVQWDTVGEHRVPKTEQGFANEMAMVFIRKDGVFVHIEVSVVCRRGRLWLCLQETYGGQMVAMDLRAATELGLEHIIVDERAVSAVPLYDENAYPDNEDTGSWRNYLSIPHAEIGKKVAKQAFRWGCVIPIEEAQPAMWAPEWPTLSEKEQSRGWREGVVTFFNMVLGWGFIVVRNGDGLIPVFVHFKQIVDEDARPVMSKGELPVLRPMGGVVLKYKEEPGTDKVTGSPITLRQATMARAVK